METAITDRYSDAILQTAQQRFAIDPAHCQLLDGFESYIYEFSRADGDFILRISHSRRRTPALIQAEVDWINYLAQGGAGVARAILSASGKLVEPIDDGQGGQFLATAFVFASGKPPHLVGWTPERYENYGRLIGRIHALSKDYTPPTAARRLEWDDSLNIDVVLPEDQPIIKERWQAVRDHLAGLPKDAASYGLIHQDAHRGNFFMDEDGSITLFDFDDCVYSWYVYDIAMVVFYWIAVDDDPVASLAEFWPHFWRGYCAENTLDPVWLAEIPVFLKLREIDLYAVLCDVTEWLASRDADDWAVRYMRNRHERIEQDVPVVAFDYTAG